MDFFTILTSIVEV